MTEQWIGRTLSKVRLQEVVGRGGMAEVYLGTHTTLNRPVAVKILLGHLSDDPDLRRRFLAEAQSVAALRHPNIVQVFDFDVVDSRPYIVMELLQGMSLAEYLRGLHQLGTTLPLETVSRLMDGLAAALDYAHDRGIFHRDVKPANVILRQSSAPLKAGIPLPPDVEPVLTDFGIARITGSTSQTMSGTILGTPAYMSPEQVRGEAADARSDNYSLGIMLYEMLAGELPFDPETDTTASVLYKQVHQTPPPLANTTVPVQMVVGRALDKDRNRRYQRAGDMAADLREALRPGADTIISPSVARKPPAARRLGWPVVAGVAAFGLVACIAGALVLRAIVAGGQAAPAATSAPTAAVAATTTVGIVLPTPAATSAPTAAVADEPSGVAKLRDSSLQLTVSGVDPAPAGFQYVAWLLAPDGTALALGPQSPNGDTLTLSYDDPDGHNLAGRFTAVAISLDPNPDPNPAAPGEVVYRAEIPTELADLLQRLDSVASGQSVTEAITAGAASQAKSYDSHRGFSIDDLGRGNLVGARQHAEHTINIAVGEGSPDFGDWDGNGNAQNPGDGFGLMRYLQA
ncbi:MAG TPA: serine/threonine-protein kinase, partial [Anaerolineales bacterium]|nr:serine/threonine-protein kinase [Anaerolineales bacterium]